MVEEVDVKKDAVTDGTTAATDRESQRPEKSDQYQRRRRYAEVTAEDLAPRAKPKRSGERHLIFEKYDPSTVEIIDESIADYVNLSSYTYPNIYGRRKVQSYYNSHISVVERLINKLMRGGTGKKIGGKVIRTEGRLQGKKVKVMKIVEKAFDVVNKQTGKNPLQVLINALQNSAPIEDTTRVRYGGISYNVAVGISAQRRLNVALKNIALAALIGSFKNRRTLADSLANELMLAANNSPDSYAIKKRVEGERIAKRAR